MRLGIDIDDTTVMTLNQIIKYVDIYDKNILGNNGKKAEDSITSVIKSIYK